MAEPHSGWIRLHRKVRDHWLWPGKKKRRYSEFEAWVDLLLSANHKETKVLVGQTLVTVERGWILTSQIGLAKRWGWNRKHVVSFLSVLKGDENLDIQRAIRGDNGYTILSICNYGKYQDAESSAPDNQPDNQPDNLGTFSGHSRDIYKNGKNVKKKNICSSSPGSTNGNGASEFTLAESFEVFYRAYPRKKSRGKAWKAWLKIRPGGELLKTMLVAIGRAKESHDWQKEGGQFIPYPASWLNSQGWEDEVEEAKEPHYGPTLYDCGKCQEVHEVGETCEAV